MELQPSLPLFTFCILFFFFLFKLFKEIKRSITGKGSPNLPPGPWNLPLIGSMLHLARSQPHHALRDLATKHGPLMHLRLGEFSAIVVSSPRVAREIYKTHDLVFGNRPHVLAGEIAFYNFSDIACSPYGDYWRLIRKICVTDLLSAKKVRSFHSVRLDEVNRVVETIRDASGSKINFTELTYSLVNRITCRATFGTRSKDEDALIQLIQEMISCIGSFDVSDLFPSLKFLHGFSQMRPRLEKLHLKLDQILEDIINEREKRLECRNKLIQGGSEARDDEDLLEVLLRLKNSPALESPITSDNIKATILDMFTAGTDTSATLIEWAMAELMRSPRVMQKVQSELRLTLKGKQTIQEADIQGLSYLKLVIKETLRLHPPAPLLPPRESREKCQIDGYTIPVKTLAIVNAWAMGRDLQYWKDAESFSPERFENSKVDYNGESYEYIPFGGGRRICPGVSFSLSSVYLHLSLLLYHFDWKLANAMNFEDLDMSETLGATCRRTNNLMLVATPCSLL